MAKTLITLEQAASRFGITGRTAYEMACTGRLAGETAGAAGKSK